MVTLLYISSSHLSRLFSVLSSTIVAFLTLPSYHAFVQINPHSFLNPNRRRSHLLFIDHGPLSSCDLTCNTITKPQCELVVLRFSKWQTIHRYQRTVATLLKESYVRSATMWKDEIKQSAFHTQKLCLSSWAKYCTLCDHVKLVVHLKKIISMKLEAASKKAQE